MRENNYEYDAFISHAVEDKIPIANELCAKLESAGLKIWYSGKELGVGDSIEKTIQKGLNRSRYGIVIFSPTYLAKNWTIREFYTLLAKEIEEHKVILPVLYNVTLDDLKNKDLLMADRFAVNADKGIDFVVQKLVQEIEKSHALKAEPAWFTKLWFILILSLVANVCFLLKGNVVSQGTTPGLHVMQPMDPRINNTMQRFDQETFFKEVNGIFSTVSGCQCNRGNQDEAFSHANNPHMTDENLVSLNSHARYSDPEDVEDQMILHHSKPRKMTMALVFQMETLAESSPEIEKDVNHMLNNVKRSANEPFIMTGLAKNKNDTGVQCSHPSCSRK